MMFQLFHRGHEDGIPQAVESEIKALHAEVTKDIFADVRRNNIRWVIAVEVRDDGSLGMARIKLSDGREQTVDCSCASTYGFTLGKARFWSIQESHARASRGAW